MQFDRKDISDEQLMRLYKTMLFPRLIEEKMLVLLRQGRISKWFSGIGQEAIAAGVVAALQPDEWIMPLHRNLAVFTGGHFHYVMSSSFSAGASRIHCSTVARDDVRVKRILYKYRIVRLSPKPLVISIVFGEQQLWRPIAIEPVVAQLRMRGLDCARS